MFSGFISTISKWLSFLLFPVCLFISTNLGHLYMIAIINHFAKNVRVQIFLIAIPILCSLDTDTEMELLYQMGILHLFLKEFPLIYDCINIDAH